MVAAGGRVAGVGPGRPFNRGPRQARPEAPSANSLAHAPAARPLSLSHLGVVEQQVAQAFSGVALRLGRHAVGQAFRQGRDGGVVARALEIAWSEVWGWTAAGASGAPVADPKTDASSPRPAPWPRAATAAPNP